MRTATVCVLTSIAIALAAALGSIRYGVLDGRTSVALAWTDAPNASAKRERDGCDPAVWDRLESHTDVALLRERWGRDAPRILHPLLAGGKAEGERSVRIVGSEAVDEIFGATFASYIATHGAIPFAFWAHTGYIFAEVPAPAHFTGTAEIDEHSFEEWFVSHIVASGEGTSESVSETLATIACVVESTIVTKVRTSQRANRRCESASSSDVCASSMDRLASYCGPRGCLGTVPGERAPIPTTIALWQGDKDLTMGEDKMHGLIWAIMAHAGQGGEGATAHAVTFASEICASLTDSFTTLSCSHGIGHGVYRGLGLRRVPKAGSWGTSPGSAPPIDDGAPQTHALLASWCHLAGDLIGGGKGGRGGGKALALFSSVATSACYTGFYHHFFQYSDVWIAEESDVDEAVEWMPEMEGICASLALTLLQAYIQGASEYDKERTREAALACYYNRAYFAPTLGLAASAESDDGGAKRRAQEDAYRMAHGWAASCVRLGRDACESACDAEDCLEACHSILKIHIQPLCWHGIGSMLDGVLLEATRCEPAGRGDATAAYDASKTSVLEECLLLCLELGPTACTREAWELCALGVIGTVDPLSAPNERSVCALISFDPPMQARCAQCVDTLPFIGPGCLSLRGKGGGEGKPLPSMGESKASKVNACVREGRCHCFVG